MSNKPSISVCKKTYEHLRATVSEMSLPEFVDGIVRSALDDPTIRDRVLHVCIAAKEKRL